MNTIETSKGSLPLRWSWGSMLQILGLFVFLFIVLGPVIVLLVELVRSCLGGNSQWLMLAVPTGRRLILLLNSLGFAAAVAAGGLVLGILGSTFLLRWDTGWRSHLRWLVFILVPIPPYVHALAWTSSIYWLNSVLDSLGLINIPVQSWVVCWWIQLMSLAPIAVGLALVGLKSVEPAVIDSARVLRTDIVGFFKVILPLAAPALMAGGGILFLLSLIDYSIPSLLNLNVYSLEIFAEFSASNEPVRAMILSFPLLVIALVVVLLSFSALRQAAQSTVWQVPTWKTAPSWPSWLIILQWLAVISLVLQLILPLFNLTADISTWQHLTSTISSAKSEIAFSFLVDVIVAALSLPLAFAIAKMLLNARKWRNFLWILIITPLAVPPPLVGIGLITLWNRPIFFDIYGSGLMPVLVGLVRFTPLAVIILIAMLRRINPELIDAARVLQSGSWQTWKSVWLPILTPGLLASFGLIFALTMGELGATLLVAPPGQATVTMRIYNFLHYGDSDTVSGLCLMMICITLLAGAVAVLVLFSRSSLFRNIVARSK